MHQEDLFGNTYTLIKPVSGYRVYNAEQERKTVRNDLPSLYSDLPEKKYDIIYADPPWDYGGKLQFDNSSKKDINTDWGKTFLLVPLISNIRHSKRRI